MSIDVGAGGRRYCCTCPEDRPTARMGKFGWRACAKRSEDRGSVQIVSNIFCSIQSCRASGESKELEKNFFGQAKSLQGRQRMHLLTSRTTAKLIYSMCSGKVNSGY